MKLSNQPGCHPQERPIRAYVGLGSNLQDPVRQVKTALAALDQLPETRVLEHSALYRSCPLGAVPQPDFVNSVAALETRLSPQALLDCLQKMERQQGRQRDTVRWGPRTLDLDLLLYGEACLQTANLTLPHPGLHRRSFVLYPLHEIAPCLVIPGRGAVVELLSKVTPEGLEIIDA
ncbi:MAG: 2-amino-4-hydroxy-6-hydroxymethyldihydropteridine diphosphokinase [Gammaproteobacteria bacterium]